MSRQNKRRKSPILALVLLGLTSLFLTSLALDGLYRDEQFDLSKNRSQGLVERMWITHSSKGGTHYHVSYHFADDAGRIREASSETSRDTYNGVHWGTSVPLKYLAVDPEQSRIDLPNETRYHWHHDIGLLIPALIICVIWVFIYSRRRRPAS